MVVTGRVLPTTLHEASDGRDTKGGLTYVLRSVRYSDCEDIAINITPKLLRRTAGRTVPDQWKQVSAHA